MSTDRKKLLDEIAKKERLIVDVMDGKNIQCEICYKPLTYYGPGSGHHPGVFCPTGCTAIRMEFKRS